ncbi:hypothetical protein FACS1894132_01990 [Clostridia bacterium]|nr:hypothetical protein FACS1894132_01990 [Clostridia bacterium]
MNTNIQIQNNTSVIITDCRRIIECDEVMVRFETSKLLITIFGKNLRINDFLSGGLEVYGEIESIEMRGHKK